MSTLLALTGAALVTWLLRILVITLVPVSRLPQRVQDTLPDVGPAVLAALAAAALFGVPRGANPVFLAGACVTALVAWRTRRLGLATVAGLVTAALLELL